MRTTFLDTQFRSIEYHEYSPQKLTGLGFGPVILMMETRYQHEMAFDESVVDSFKLADLSPGGASKK